MTSKAFQFITLLVLLASTAAASDPWLRIASESTEIWTDAGEHKANQAFRSLRQIREILSAVQPSEVAASRPLRLVIFRSDTDFARFRPAAQPQAAGFFLPGQQYDYILMKDVIVPGLQQVILHEYLHLFLHEQKLPVPHWFDEGMAELFSNAQMTRTEVKLGLPIAAHVRSLLAAADTDLTTLFKPGTDPLFYPKSWALVRLITLDPAYRAHAAQFLSLVAKGSPHTFAFEEAFGKSLDAVAGDVRESLNGKRLSPWVLKTTLPVSKDQVAPVVQPTPAAELMMVGLLQDMQRVEEARVILNSLATTNQDNAEIEAQLALIAARQGQPDEAVGHYTKAIQLGTKDPRVYFERAMVRRENAAVRGQVIDDLRKAVELDPDYKEAYQQLNALALNQQPPSAKPAAKGWNNRKGDRHIDGSLVELDCSTTPASFLLRTPAGVLTLVVSDPSQVVIGNDPGINAELNCGTMPPRAVSLEYLSTTKEITAIQFK